jgi:hypothetical protein
MLLHLQWSCCVANFPQRLLYINAAHWQLLRCIIWVGEITCADWCTQGWIEALSVDDVFVKTQPFHLKFMFRVISNSCAKNYGPIGIYANIGKSRMLLAELPDAHDVGIQGFPSTLIGAPLHFGVLPRSPPPRTAEYPAQSQLVTQLEQEASFLLLHRMPPPSLIIHEPAFLWAWPLDAVTVAPSASPLLPSVEPTSVLSLVGLHSCKCTPHKGSGGGGGEERVGGGLLRLDLGGF